MKIKYDDVLIVQIKTTCKDAGDSLRDKELIEIGGCFLNAKSLSARDPFSVIVKPSVNLTQYCIEKTGITPEDVSSGVDFLELLSFLEEYNVNSMPWASYGSFAQHVFLNQCRQASKPFPFSDRFLNIKSLFPLIFNLPYELSLKEAIKKLDIKVSLEGDSMDDALNVSILFKEIMRGPGAIRGNFVTCMKKR